MNYYDEFGKDNERIMVMLHEAGCVQTFVRQYELADRFHIIVPHIMGYGKEATDVFDTETAKGRLLELIAGLQKKVTLVGFSLGAQLGFELVTKHQEYFERVVLVSPWLLKKPDFKRKVVKQNDRWFKLTQKRWIHKLEAVLLGYKGDMRREYVEYAQAVSPMTNHSMADNDIVFTDEFSSVTVPVLALAGSKEPKEIILSVKTMGEYNENCEPMVIKGAAHNIPRRFSAEFNRLLREWK